MVFGSVVSASCWEPFWCSIEHMTEVYFDVPELVDTYNDYLWQLDVDSPTSDQTLFVKAMPCSYNQGILDHSGCPRMKNFIYVDDCWLIAIASLVPYATFISRLPPCHLCHHRIPWWEPPTKSTCHGQMGWDEGQLVYHHSWSCYKYTWYDDWYYPWVLTWDIAAPAFLVGAEFFFTVNEIECLAGKLACLSEGANWIFHMMPNIYMSIAHCLWNNKSWLIQNSKSFWSLLAQTKRSRDATNAIDADTREINVAIKLT